MGGNGGAGGMMFFVDEAGRQWYIGGMAGEHAHAVTEALNLLLDVLG